MWNMSIFIYIYIYIYIYIFNYKSVYMYGMIISGVDNLFFKLFRRLLLT